MAARLIVSNSVFPILLTRSPRQHRRIPSSSSGLGGRIETQQDPTRHNLGDTAGNWKRSFQVAASPRLYPYPLLDTGLGAFSPTGGPSKAEAVLISPFQGLRAVVKGFSNQAGWSGLR